MNRHHPYGGYDRGAGAGQGRNNAGHQVGAGRAPLPAQGYPGAAPPSAYGQNPYGMPGQGGAGGAPSDYAFRNPSDLPPGSPGMPSHAQGMPPNMYGQAPHMGGPSGPFETYGMPPMGGYGGMPPAASHPHGGMQGQAAYGGPPPQQSPQAAGFPGVPGSYGGAPAPQAPYGEWYGRPQEQARPDAGPGRWQGYGPPAGDFNQGFNPGRGQQVQQHQQQQQQHQHMPQQQFGFPQGGGPGGPGGQHQPQQLEKRKGDRGGGKFTKNQANESHDPRSQKERPCRTLFIRNIDFDTDPAEVEARMREFGEVKSFFDLTGKRGLAFCTFYDIRAAEAAKAALQGHQYNGRPLDLHYSLPKEEDQQKRCDRDKNQGTLFIVLRRAERALTEQDVEICFGPFGEIKGIRKYKEQNNCRFLEFYDSRSCLAAHDAMGGAPYLGGDWDVKFAWDLAVASGGGTGAGGAGNKGGNRQNMPRNQQSNGPQQQGWQGNAPAMGYQGPPHNGPPQGDSDASRLEQAQKVQQLLASLKNIQPASTAPAPAAAPAPVAASTSQANQEPAPVSTAPAPALPPNLAALLGAAAGGSAPAATSETPSKAGQSSQPGNGTTSASQPHASITAFSTPSKSPPPAASAGGAAPGQASMQQLLSMLQNANQGKSSQ